MNNNLNSIVVDTDTDSGTYLNRSAIDAHLTSEALKVLQHICKSVDLVVPQFISHWSSDTQKFFRGYWDHARWQTPRECEVCEKTIDGVTKFVWHHTDHTLRPEMVQARDKAYEVANTWEMGMPNNIWRQAYYDFAVKTAMYYLEPIDKTVYVCAACHGRLHKEINTNKSK